MKTPHQNLSPRVIQLRLNCEMQRQQLAEAYAEIEQRFHGIDTKFLSVKNFVAKPGFVAGSLAMLLLGRRSHGNWFGKLRRGLFWFATARRGYQMFKRH